MATMTMGVAGRIGDGGRTDMTATATAGGGVGGNAIMIGVSNAEASMTTVAEVMIVALTIAGGDQMSQEALPIKGGAFTCLREANLT